MLKLIKIIVMLLFVQVSFAQNLLTLMADDGIIYETETLNYIARVEADGGTVMNANLLNDFILDAKTNGYYDSLLTVIDANFGVKKNANNKVSKVYDLVKKIDVHGTLFNNDYLQADTSKAPTLSITQNGLYGLTFDGSNDVMASSFPNGSEPIAQPLTAFNTIKPLAVINNKNYIDNSDARIIFFGGSGAVSIYNGGVVADTAQLVTNTAYIYAGIFSGANSKIYRNNTLKMSGNAGTDGWGSYSGVGGFYLGASGAIQNANIIIYNFIVKKGIGNIPNINGFLNSKYGVY